MPVKPDMLCHHNGAEADGCSLTNMCSDVGINRMRLRQHGSAHVTVTDEATANLHPQETLVSFGQCQQLKSTLAEGNVVVVLQSCLLLLDTVDVFEQSRILCAIRQHHLYTRHCLNTVKHQMTLGGLVAPKCLKQSVSCSKGMAEVCMPR